MFDQLLTLLERFVVAHETIAKNSSGKPTTTAGLEAVASGETSEPVKKKRAAKKTTAKKEAAPAKDATKSSADSDATTASESTTDAGEDVVEPTKDELKSAQEFKKALLATGRGKENYVERLKKILDGNKAETVPVEDRDAIMAAAVAEFAEENDDDI